ncbi:type IV pilus modification protein PilV [Xenophilus arseniciresistens]|uniref:Type IV pilus modification protein PilV n=1 Tax=Xenophilus arseniciresistens TaxID=1283306 RepID=A0AAE3N3R3_9BURK|nr:type IV pilus modification protein PilV [Xenophilus arseniciresistens]MDA7414985.1 type IV pilus modification protein PilV [Xenophilus arseniciresistens]
MKNRCVHPSRPRRSRGFALIEVLISVLLLSLGVLGLIGLQARAMSMSGEAEDRNRAAVLADDLASLIWMKRSLTLSDSELDAWEAAGQNQLPNATLSVDAVSGNANAVDVTITWRAPSRAQGDNSTLRTRVVLSQDPT